MSIKKFKISVAALVVSLLVPSSTFADGSHGNWDYQGSDIFTTQSKNFKSGGGDFKICLRWDSKHGYYQLYEEDSFDTDDKVRSGVKFDGAASKSDGFHYGYLNAYDSYYCHTYKDVSGYTDGTDDQAEFYVIKYSGGNSTLQAYD